MGRGLSDLQKNILMRAYQNHSRECLPNPTYDVTVEYPYDLPSTVEPPSEDAMIAALTRMLSGEGEGDGGVERPRDIAYRELADRLRTAGVEILHAVGGAKAGWVVVVVAQAVGKTEADATASLVETAGLVPVVSRISGPGFYRVMVFDQPREKDLRTLIPEAFVEPWPDGFWRPGCGKAYLVSGRFETSAEANAFAEELQRRGVDAEPPEHRYHQFRKHAPVWDFYVDEAMVALFGCRYSDPRTGPPPEFPCAVVERVRGRLNRAAFGAAQYTAAAVSISRAFDRLETRGLVEKMGYRYEGGQWRDVAVALTDQGLSTARALLANTSVNRTSVSQYEEAA